MAATRPSTGTPPLQGRREPPESRSRTAGRRSCSTAAGAGEPPRRHVCRRHTRGARRAVPIQCAGAGEDGRGLGAGQDVGWGMHCDFDTARWPSSSARTLGSRMASRAPASSCARSRRPGTFPDRHRPAAQRNRGDGEFHLAGGPGADPGASRRWPPSSLQEDLVAPQLVAEHTTGYEEWRTILGAVPMPDTPPSAASTRTLLRRDRPADRRREERLDDRRPRRADERALHAQQLSRAAGVAADRPLRPRGTNNAFVPLVGLSQSRGGRGRRLPGRRRDLVAPNDAPASPVTGAGIIIGLIRGT